MTKPIYPLKSLTDRLPEEICTLSHRELMLATGQASLEDILADFATPVDLYLRCMSPEMEALRKKLIQLIHKYGSGTLGQVPKFNLHLEMLLSNLFVAQSIEAGRFISYSRLANDYSQNRYNNSGIGYRPLMHVVTLLESLGLIEHYSGTQSPGSGRRGLLARFRGTPQLFKLVSRPTYRKILSSLTKEQGYCDPIHLRNEKRKLIDYADTECTRAMRILVEAYNTSLLATDISLDKEGLNKIIGMTSYNPIRNQVHRIFSNRSFELGGRFYGGWWQDLSGELRSHILLDGKQTVELDFGALVAHQAYASKNLNYWDQHEDGDPYALGNCDLPRTIIKLAFQCALNTKNRENAASAIIGEINAREDLSYYHGIRDEEAMILITRILQKHELIGDVLFSRPALRFQNMDSKICEVVIGNFLEVGKAILTIHDSFLVVQKQEVFLRHVMERAYKAVYGTSVPKIRSSHG